MDFAKAKARTLFCPRQRELEDCPVIEIDINGGGSHIRNKLTILKRREELIAPFEVERGRYRVHVTPLANPKNHSKKELSSHHIIRFFNSKERKQSYKVDCLIRDENLYFVAFRRGKRDNSSHEVKIKWGRWFAFKDTKLDLPEFIRDPEILKGVSSRYTFSKLICPGGDGVTLTKIFHVLALYEDKPWDDVSFKKAVYAIMMFFCETRRFRTVLEAMSNILDHQKEAEQISNFLWERIHKWDSLCGIVLRAYKANDLSFATLLPPWCERTVSDLHFMNCLIGPQKELLILKMNRDHLRMTDFEFEELHEDPQVDQVANPGFVEPE